MNEIGVVNGEPDAAAREVFEIGITSLDKQLSSNSDARNGSINFPHAEIDSVEHNFGSHDLLTMNRLNHSTLPLMNCIGDPMRQRRPRRRRRTSSSLATTAFALFTAASSFLVSSSNAASVSSEVRSGNRSRGMGDVSGNAMGNGMRSSIVVQPGFEPRNSNLNTQARPPEAYSGTLQQTQQMQMQPHVEIYPLQSQQTSQLQQNPLNGEGVRIDPPFQSSSPPSPIEDLDITSKITNSGYTSTNKKNQNNRITHKSHNKQKKHSGKQVILRPRSKVPNHPGGNSLEGMAPVQLPIMGMENDSDSAGSNRNGNQQVYYYDEGLLRSPQSKTNQGSDVDPMPAPELTLPEIVYDVNGKPMKLEDLHDGGKNEVYLEVRPRAVWGADWKSLSNSLYLENLNDKILQSITAIDTSHTNFQSQDQMIVFVTVATMAILVGALSAKRLRSKKLLEHCMEPDLEEDWEEELERMKQEKKEYGGDYGGRGDGESSVGGFGSVMGGRRGPYESFGGNLHWRGDMEKFDV